jgi:hypothetical protein
MIKELISSIKGDLISQVTSKFGIGADKADESVEMAKDNVTGTLKSEASKGNFLDLKKALSGSQTTKENGIINKIITNYTGDLTTKLGLSGSQSSSIANFIIPFIFSKIGKKTGSEGDIDEADILSMLGGGDTVKNIKKGLAQKMGGLFGSKK